MWATMTTVRNSNRSTIVLIFLPQAAILYAVHTKSGLLACFLTGGPTVAHTSHISRGPDSMHKLVELLVVVVVVVDNVCQKYDKEYREEF